MSYTSPSPANVASNNNQTTWWIPARNLSSLTATNVAVQVTLLPVGGLAPVTYVAEQGSFSFITGIWQLGTLAAGATKWLKIVTSVADIGLAPYTLTSVVSGDGVDPNNVNNTLIQTLTSVVCDPSAGAVGNPNSCTCVDVSANDTACTHGVTEFRITEDSVVNSTTYVWDETTGKGHFTHTNATQDITFTYSIWCDGGDGFLQVSGPATVTIPALIEDLAIFNHKADFIVGSTLTDPEVAILQTQPAYNSLTAEQIRSYCWETLYNADSDLVGGWAHDCNAEQDTRHMVFCSEVECTEPLDECPSCPNTNMPVDVAAYVNSVENYIPQKGDIVTVYHPGAISVYEYTGVAWVRNTCGCITFLNNPYPVSFTITGTTNKTATITLSDTNVLTTMFTDIDTNTTYTLAYATVSGVNYIRLVNNLGNIVSNIALPAGDGCCCDCVFNLIPTQDGALASTNCTIDWDEDAIWEARPIAGDEGDWITLDGGIHNGVYDNGAVGLYIRVRYTLNGCEKFSNIVTPIVCPCWAELTTVNHTLDIDLVTENCAAVDWNAAEWQVRTDRIVWETYQTGGASSNYTTNLSPLLDGMTPDIVIEDPYGEFIGIRVKYTDNGCVKYTNVQYFYSEPL